MDNIMCNSEFFELPKLYVNTIKTIADVKEEDTYEGVLLRDLIDELYKFPKIIEESSQTSKLSFMFTNFISIFDSNYKDKICKVLKKHYWNGTQFERIPINVNKILQDILYICV